MTIFGVDYSGDRPDPACMASKDVRFACRYLEPASDWKTLTPDEVVTLLQHNILIVGCYETSIDAALGGYSVGRRHAEGVAAEAIKVGLPNDRPIYFAVDFDARGAQLAGPVRDYFRGLGSVLPVSRIGCYAGYYPIRYLFDEGLIEWGWQTYAWSRERRPDGRLGILQWDSRAQLQQYKNGVKLCGGTVDYNRAMVDDYGQWPLVEIPEPEPEPEPEPAPPYPGPLEDDDMWIVGKNADNGGSFEASPDGRSRLHSPTQVDAEVVFARPAWDPFARRWVTSFGQASAVPETDLEAKLGPRAR